MAYLYVLIDESGNYAFSSKGTSYLVLTSLMTTDVSLGVMELYELKHRLIDLGADIEIFTLPRIVKLCAMRSLR